MRSFVEGQFGYYPLVWIFHGREINRKINHVHERSLRVVYRDYNSSFKDLLRKDLLAINTFLAVTFCFLSCRDTYKSPYENSIKLVTNRTIEKDISKKHTIAPFVYFFRGMLWISITKSPFCQAKYCNSPS